MTRYLKSEMQLSNFDALELTRAEATFTENVVSDGSSQLHYMSRIVTRNKFRGSICLADRRDARISQSPATV